MIRNAVPRHRFFEDFRNNHVLILLHNITKRDLTNKKF